MLGLKKRAADSQAIERSHDRSKTVGLSLVLAVVLPLLALGLMYKQVYQPVGRLNSDAALEIAQLSRNIAEGKGFTTNVIRPQALLHSKDITKMPDMTNAPLFPRVEALFMAKEASETRALAASALFFLLTIPVLYLLARGMFSQNAAIFAVVAYTLSSAMLLNAISGLPWMMATFLLTWFFYACFRFAQESSPPEEHPVNQGMTLKWALGAGLILSACYLTAYPLFWISIPALFFMWRTARADRLRNVAAFAVAFLVPTAFWMVRNYSLTGHALYGLRALEVGMFTADNPGLSLYRSMTKVNLLELLQADKLVFVRKVVGSLYYLFTILPVMAQAWLAPFFIVGLFYSFRRTGVNAIRVLALWSMLFVTLGIYGLAGEGAALMPFAPIVLAYGAAFLVRLLTDAQLPSFYSRVVSTVAVLLVSVQFIALVSTGRPKQQYPRQAEAFLSQATPVGVPILTDRAVDVAWYAGKKAILLPKTEEDFKALDKMSLPKAAKDSSKDKTQNSRVIYLSRMLSPNSGITPDWQVWSTLYFNLILQARQEKFADITGGTLKGYAVYRDIDPESAAALFQQGAVILARPDGITRNATNG